MAHGNDGRKYRVKCFHCKTNRLETEFGIYEVGADRYFCNQDCMDKYYKTERNVA